MSSSPRAVAWTRSLALGVACLALLAVAAEAAAEAGFFFAAAKHRAAVFSPTPTTDQAHVAWAQAREALAPVALALTLTAAVALAVQGALNWGDAAARRAMIAAPLLAAAGVMLLPAVDARSFLLSEETRSLARLPVLLLGAAGALLLAWPHKGARLVGLAGASALVAGALHAALRTPYLAGPIDRVPNFAYEALWGALAWTLLALALGLALARGQKSGPSTVTPANETTVA